MKKVLKLCIFLISTICFGQTYERGGFSNIGTGNSSIVNYTNLSDGIIGNRYFTDTWSIGHLEINDTIKSRQSKIQYDLVNGDLLIGTNKNKTGFVILDKSVTGFLMETKDGLKQFVRKKKADFIDSSIEKHFFLNPYPISNKQYILIDYKKVLSEPYNTRSSYTNTSLNRKYKKFKRYYILNSNNKYVLVKLKEKSILKALSDKKIELNKYVKKNKIKLKKEKGLVKLLTYYHSL